MLYIGRISAFINRKKAFSEKQPTGGVGFFECIDDLKLHLYYLTLLKMALRIEKWKRWMDL